VDKVACKLVAVVAMLRVNTKNQFEEWLDEHHWLEDCRVLCANPDPAQVSSAAESATLDVAFQIAGSNRAYSTRESRVFHRRSDSLGLR
jgi:hypothetical protein